jgi:prepilin-type N-terminal cleavage/methylation domain-containing protein
MRPRRLHGFTLVEILIVVVILGILAAIVIGLFGSATTEAQREVTFSELQKLRRHVGVYQARNSQRLPAVTDGDGTWGEIVGRDYLLSPPTNAWVGGANSRRVIIGTAPDTSYHTNYGWIFDASTGQVWAAGFSADDEALPRN